MIRGSRSVKDKCHNYRSFRNIITFKNRNAKNRVTKMIDSYDKINLFIFFFKGSV